MCVQAITRFSSFEITTFLDTNYTTNCILPTYDNASCKPSLTLVDVEPKLKDSLYFYTPLRIRVNRCSGDCGQRAQQCLPTHKENITLEVSFYPKSSLISMINKYIFFYQ